ncbi:MAG: serine aminopeptidase domain-containing protein [bacterium]
MHEQPFFFGEAGKKLYGVIYPPAAGRWINGGWVLCAPYGIERFNSRRFLVKWSRELSQLGYWVLRFDYRGRGDSTGRFEDYTMEDHVEDIHAAVRELERKAGVPCRGLCGLRLGATLAAETVRRTGGNPMLVLWEPVVQGKEYINELLRAAMAGEMIQVGEKGRTRVQLRADLENNQDVVVQGCFLTRKMYHSLSAVDLLCQPRPGKGPILILNILGNPNQAPSTIFGLLHKKYAKGGEVSLETCQAPVPWVGDRQYVTDTEAIFRHTVSWILDHDTHSTSGNPIPWEPGAKPPAGNSKGIHVVSAHNGSLRKDDERLVRFLVKGIPIWGILKEPAPGDPKKPLVIMQGRRSLYRSLAGKLAEKGWASLCFDPRGFGESLGDWDFTTEGELFYAMETGLMYEDCVGAVHFAERKLGYSSCVLIGLCGDAITAVLAAANDPRIRGIVPLELPFRQSCKNYYEGAADYLVFLLSSKLYKPHLKSSLRVKIWKRIKPLIFKWIHCMRAGLSQVSGLYSPTSHLRLLQKKFGPRLNKHLFHAFQNDLHKNLPVLCLFGSTNNFTDFSTVLEFIGRDQNDINLSLHYHVIPKADHAFSHPNHTEAMIEVILAWLEKTIAQATPAPLVYHPERERPQVDSSLEKGNPGTSGLP